MENTLNGKNRSSPPKRNHHQPHHQSNGYSNHSMQIGGGAIMESLDPSLVGNDIEEEMASAGIFSGNQRNKPHQEIRSFPYTERSNMNSSTNSFESSGHGSKNANAMQREFLSTEELQSLNLHSAGQDGDQLNNKHSFVLLEGGRDNLTVSNAQEFALRLGCGLDSPRGSPDGEGDDLNLPDAKVISIIGNTGEGKSYALNRTFFARDDDPKDQNTFQEVFSTSPSPDSCTMGVWAAYDPRLKLIILDTEGMLGNAGAIDDRQDVDCDQGLNENHRTRQLLKVLAISDVVIYKSRAERLHTDLFYFMGDASKAYNEHFSSELQKVKLDRGGASMSMGPTFIIFHETRYTDTLSEFKNGQIRSAENMIRDRLASLNQDISAFSKIRYFGIRRGDNVQGNPKSHDLGSSPASNVNEESEIFSNLRDLVKSETEDMSVRSPRSITLIYKTFQSLNTKFSGEISSVSHRSFPDEYFTCQAKCSACEGRCTRPMNHEEGINGVGHQTQTMCIYQKKLENKEYLCLRCFKNGRRIVVVPKASSSEEGSWVGLATYAWSGYVLECRICGVIYRSRQHWYGNSTPESEAVVQTEICHIWPGVRSIQGTQNAARRLLDGVQALSESVSTISSAVSPSVVNGSKTVSGWMADRIAPDYWRPNCDITNCHHCDAKFTSSLSQSSRPTRNSNAMAISSAEKIHHCRACGEGFCDTCSNYRMPCPDRGWDPGEAVRVCKTCYDRKLNTNQVKQSAHAPSREHQETVQARRYGEKVVGTLNSLASAMLEYPISAIKETARPSYWVPDDEITSCFVCDILFENAGPSSSLTSSQTNNSTIQNQTISSSTQQLAKLHHCRKCGQGVCDDCSRTKKPVPSRGWDQPVRVCDKCCAEDMRTS